MKKIILSLMLFISLVSYSQSSLTLKLGGSFNGNFEKEYWNEATKTSLSYQGVFEFQKKMNNYLTLGFGSGYYQGARLEKVGAGSTNGTEDNFVLFNSVPLYLTAQIYFLNSKDLNAYIKFNGGYSYNLDDKLAEKKSIKISDGNYYGLGFGVEAKLLVLEVLYEINEASAYQSGKYKDTGYNRISAFVGIKF